MAKFRLTTPGYIQNAFRADGTVLDLDCKKVKDDEVPLKDDAGKIVEGVVKLRDGSCWKGKELPPVSALPADPKEQAAAPAPTAPLPKPNP